jgi:capsular polysaccharide export protein
MFMSKTRTERVLWSITTTEDVRFAKRFAAGFEGTIATAHTNFVSMAAQREGRMLPPPRRRRASDAAGAFDPAQCFNVVSGRLTAAEAESAYWGALEQYERVIQEFDLVMIPSGRHVHQLALKRAAREAGVKMLFIGYGNLPNKTIFDPWGTDADSMLFKEKNRALRSLRDPPLDAEQVISEVMAEKRAEKSIPQRARAGYKQKLAAVFAADAALQAVTGRVSDRRARYLFAADEGPNGHTLSSETFEVTPDGIFFPLQLSTDVQVLLNYEGGSIFTAIDEVAAIGRAEKRFIYYRPHPAERDQAKVEAYIQSQHGDIFRRTAQPIHDIFEALEDVIVINSTVGLEAKACGKRVRFIGRSLYDALDRQELALYMKRYLLDVNYFDGPPLSSDMVRSIVERARLGDE